MIRDRFVGPEEVSFFGSGSEWLFSSKGAKELADERKRETMALLIGNLSRENDPATLNAIAQAVIDNPAESALPLISMNKTAAVQFERAAGQYSGLSVLRLQHAKSFDEDRWESITRDKGSDPTIIDIVNIVL